MNGNQEINVPSSLKDNCDRLGVRGYRLLVWASRLPVLEGTINHPNGGLTEKARFGEGEGNGLKKKRCGRALFQGLLPNEVQARSLLIGSLVTAYSCAEEVKEACFKQISVMVSEGVAEEKLDGYRRSLNLWLQVVGPEIDKHVFASIALDLKINNNPNTGEGILSNEGQREIDETGFSVSYFPSETHSGLAVFVIGNRRQSLAGKRELHKGDFWLSTLYKRFNFQKRSKEKSVNIVILPSGWLTGEGFAFSDYLVALSQNKNSFRQLVEGVEDGKWVHELIHLVFMREFGFSPVLGILEGTAEGVAKIETSHPLFLAAKQNKERLEKNAGRHIGIQAKCGQTTRISGTKLLEVKNSGDPQSWAYKLDRLVIAIRLYFPESWPDIIKNFYGLTCDNFFDSKDGARVIKKEPRERAVLLVKRRKAIHTALVGAVGRFGNESEKKLILGKLSLLSLPEDNQGTATFLEAITWAMLGGLRESPK